METRQVDFEALIKRVLEQWKKLFILGIVFGILWCGYKYVSFAGSNSDAVPSGEETSEETDQYVYYTHELAEINEKIGEVQQYLEKTILNDIDPYNAYQGACSFSAAADDSAGAAVIPQLWAYLKSGINYAEVAEKYQTEPQYIGELVTINLNDADYGSISVTLASPEEEMTRDILNVIRNEGKSAAERISAESGIQANVLVSDANVSKGIEPAMMEKYLVRLNSINTLIDRRTRFEDQQSIARSYATSSAQPTFGIKKIIRYLGTGFLGGFVFGFLALSLMLLKNNAILSADEFAKQLKTKNLNNINSHLGKTIISRKELKTADSSEMNQKLRVLTDKLKKMNETGHYIVVSELDEQTIRKLNGYKAEDDEVHLNFVNIQVAQDYLSGRNNDCDGMIILGEIGKTKYNTMEAFLNDVKDETPLIGVITI